MNVMLDTHVLVSAVATHGLCADVFRDVMINHRLVVCPALIAEVKVILSQRIGVPSSVLSDYIRIVSAEGIVSENSIFLIAYTNKADLIVTCDPELIKLETICSMRILSPKAFWEMGEDRT